ncbi:unnamed protein product [Adineta steineri]|uniref:Uncharacterized protein n=1 Tax=Adineta steineri TaxID=433720 RepID=A0A814Q450_9BILA|nr:unnamed protein product [Adineta steineri]
MVEAEIWFYDVETQDRVCLIYSTNFTMAPLDSAKCREHGITWESTNIGTHYTMTIGHPKLDFLTTIQFDSTSQQYAAHFNIYVWQPESLIGPSTGICTQFDPECQLKSAITDSEDEDENASHQRRIITESQAKSICNIHINSFMNTRRRAPHHRSSSLNIRTLDVLTACVADIMFTGEPKVAESMVNVLMIEDLTSDMTNISSIAWAIQSRMEEAVAIVNEAIEEAHAEVSQLLDPTTITSPLSSEPPSTTTTSTTTVTTPKPTSTTTATTSATTTNAQTTTTPPPLASFKCAIYENMYINTWHQTNQASPPIKNCAGSSGNFEIVKNKFVKYTLRTSGSSIDELTLILFDEASNKAICTVFGIDQDFGWMDCEQNGINPSLIRTATHETLTVYYAKGNFTTIVTRDIGFNVGRFVINVYQSPELAIPSTGICKLSSSCAANGRT